jgi:hypothetical protein
VVNYFIGPDRKNWRSGIPTYAKVRYERVYPGVDLVYYGNPDQFECDLIVAPGANPNDIRLAFDGADGLEIDSHGDAVVRAGRGTMLLRRPFAYQELGGARKRVAAHYRRIGKSTVAVQVASYDPQRTLTIDPIVNYQTFLGGTFFDSANAVATDSAGDTYVTGITCSANFPTTATAVQPSVGGSCDAFVSKFSSSGTLLFSTYLGGSGFDQGNAIAVDGAGESYIAGSTSGGFPTTAGAAQTTFSGGSSDAFLSKISSDGTALIYSTYLGGEAFDDAFAIAIPKGCPAACDAFVAGQTTSAHFPATPGAFQTANGGTLDPFDAFVARLNASGSFFKYATYLGGHESDGAFAIAVDAGGNAYVAGFADAILGSNFPITAAAAQTIFGGTADAFVTKLNPNGSALVYSTYLGGPGYDQATGIAIDSNGNAYVTGITFTPGFLGPFTAFGPGGAPDDFVVKLSSDGSSSVYQTFLGGLGYEQSNAIAVDAAGDAYIAGITTFTDFPQANPVQPQPAAAGRLLKSSDGGATIPRIA